MKNLIPFKETIEFDTKIAEITSIALEHNYKLGERGVNGSFVVSGEYKAHELSANKESFNYSLPFTLELDEQINRDTLNLEIIDFEYSFSDNKLNVDIEYSLEAEINEVREEPVTFEPIEEIPEISIEEHVALEASKEVNIQTETDIELRDDKSEQMVVDSVANEDNTYITYHIHIVKENETLEQICLLYNVTASVISEYNENTNCNIGDKLIIPEEKNE